MSIVIKGLRGGRGHMHAEAFCLMHYHCSDCNHHEVLWNSRDGVTPFCMPCPSCGHLSLSHAYFDADQYAPDHKPHQGQRVWIAMTRQRAVQIATARIHSRNAPGIEADRLISSVADDIYHDGHAPDLRIEGYQETTA